MTTLDRACAGTGAALCVWHGCRESRRIRRSKAEGMACKQKILSLLVLVGVLVAVSAIARPVHAEARTWTGADDSEWFNAANWDPEGLPDPADDLTIDTGTPETAGEIATDDDGSITVTGGVQATLGGHLLVGDSNTGTLTVEAGSQVSSHYSHLGYGSGSIGTATVTGGGSRWTNSGYLWVGLEGVGTLTVEAGGEVSNTSGFLGYLSGSTGTATVTGAGSTWTNYDRFVVGHEGAGTLTVADGGLVTARTLYASLDDLFGNGTITVQGGAVLDADLVFDGTHGLTQALPFGTGGTLNLTVDGSQPLGVGYKGAGTLRIAGGRTAASLVGYLGLLSGSTGTATVTGADSTWTNGGLYVGYKGAGTLTVTDGGLVTAEALCASLSDLFGDGTIVAHGAVLDADLAFDSTGGLTPALAFGTGGTLNLNVDGSQPLGVGYKGTGTLHIADGLSVPSTYGTLGDQPGSTGTATVTGDGSTWANSGPVYVADWCTAALNVEAGGEVSNTSGFLGFRSSSAGTARVTGEGSRWTNAGALYVGYYGAGTLTVDDGGEVSSASGYLGFRSSSTGAATVTGAGAAWTNLGGLYIGGASDSAGGTGELTVSTGGVVEVYGTVTIWDGGTVNLQDGGSLSADTVQNGGMLAWSGGSLDAGVLRMGGDGVLNVTCSPTLTADVEIRGGTFIVGGSDVLTALGAFGTTAVDTTFVKDGPGALVINGLQDHVPGALFEILAGMVEMNSDASGTGLLDDADLSILVTGATLDFGCDQHLDTLEIGNGGLVRLTGAGVVVVKHLVMNGFDLGPMTLTPEPATLALLVMGGLGLLGFRRRGK